MAGQVHGVGIVGVGTVGTAVAAAFEGKRPLYLRDPRRREDSCAMSDLVRECAVVFVCVPTPPDPSGDADLSAFIEVVREFVDAGGAHPNGPVLCVKSAVPPHAIHAVVKKYPALRLVVSPEFLRERSPIADMLAMRSLVLGGHVADCAVVEDVFRRHSNVTGPMRTSPGLDAVGAAFLKYQENCFLAMKVSFMNEFYDLFQTCGSDCTWEDLQTAFHQDHERMGSTHWHVPGPDGRRGWGGHCLPKDLSATRRMGERAAVPTPLLDAAWERNQLDRATPTLPTGVQHTAAHTVTTRDSP